MKRFFSALLILSLIFNLVLNVPVAADALEANLVPNVTSNTLRPGDMVDLQFQLLSEESVNTNNITFQCAYDQALLGFVDEDAYAAVSGSTIPITDITTIGVNSDGLTVYQFSMFTSAEEAMIYPQDSLLTLRLQVKKTASSGYARIRVYDGEIVNRLDASSQAIVTLNPQGFSETVLKIISDDTPTYTITGTFKLDYASMMPDGLLPMVGSVSTEALNRFINHSSFDIGINTSKPTLTFSGKGSVTVENPSNPVDAEGYISFNLTYNMGSDPLLMNGYPYSEQNLTLNLPGHPAQSITLSQNQYNYAMNSIPIFQIGDVAGRLNKMVDMNPDGYIDNIDFTGWLNLFNDVLSETGDEQTFLRADLNMDNKVDNGDYTYWFYKYQLAMGQKSVGDLPDLTATYNADQPYFQYDATQFDHDVIVKNMGQASSAPTQMKVWQVGGYYRVDLPALSPGEAYLFTNKSAATPITSPVQYLGLKVVIDPDDLIKESNELNNEPTKVMLVYDQNGPDLLVESMTYDGAVYALTGHGTVNIVVKNQGKSASITSYARYGSNYYDTYFDDFDDNLRTSGSVMIPPIQPGASYSLSLPIERIEGQSLQFYIDLDATTSYEDVSYAAQNPEMDEYNNYGQVLIRE